MPVAARAVAHRPLDRRGDARRRRVRGDRRLPEGDDRRPRGDLDDHAQLDRDLGRDLLLRLRAAASEPRERRLNPDLERRSRQRRTCPSSGGARCCKGSTSASSSRSPRSSSSALLLTARRSGSRCARSASTRRRRATAASASSATTSWRWRSPARSRVSPARSTCSAGSSSSRHDILVSHIGFLGIAVAAARPEHARSASSSPRCSSARSHRHLEPQPRPDRLPAGARRQPDADHPGPGRALRRRRPARALDLEGAATGGTPEPRAGRTMTVGRLGPRRSERSRSGSPCRRSRRDRRRAARARRSRRRVRDLGRLARAVAARVGGDRRAGISAIVARPARRAFEQGAPGGRVIWSAH